MSSGLQKIDHIGIAVRSLAVAIPLYEQALGLQCERIEEVAEQKVKTAFFLIGEVHLELLEPTSPESPVAKFIESRGEGVHHVAFATGDILQALDGVKQAGLKVINEQPVQGAGGKQVAFLHPKSTLGVLMEFCQPKYPH